MPMIELNFEVFIKWIHIGECGPFFDTFCWNNYYFWELKFFFLFQLPILEIFKNCQVPIWPIANLSHVYRMSYQIGNNKLATQFDYKTVLTIIKRPSLKGLNFRRFLEKFWHQRPSVSGPNQQFWKLVWDRPVVLV